MKRKLALTAVALLATVGLAGCKATEKYSDAPASGPNDKTPAQVFSMPDGFSNWSEKCDGHGFRVFIVFHGDSSYAAITAVPDATCK